MEEVNRLLELLSNIPSEIKEFVTTGRSFSSLGVERVWLKENVLFLIKRNIYTQGS